MTQRRFSRSLLGAVTAAALGAVGLGGPAGAVDGSGGTGPVVAEGTVEVVVNDDPDAHDHAGPALVVETVVTTDDGGYPVPEALAEDLVAGQSVAVTLADAAPGSAVLEVEPTADAVTTADALPTPGGAHTLTVLPVYWTSPDTATQTSLTAQAQDTADYWAEQTGGRMSTTVDVAGWAAIPDPGTCDSEAIYADALEAHPSAPAPSTYDHVAVYFPYDDTCPFAGRATLGGGRIWVNGYQDSDALAHELGHNLGLGHANVLVCGPDGARTPLATSGCTEQPYHDWSDVMGFALGTGPGNLNGPLAGELGLVQHVTASPSAVVTADLAPLADTSSTRAVVLPVTGGDVHVSYRPAAGRDAERDPSRAGVHVHFLAADQRWPASHLLDMHRTVPGLEPVDPVTTGWSMPPGAVYAFPGSDYTLSVLSVGATARVRVVPAGLDTTPPSPVTFTSSPTLTSTTHTVTWQAASDAGAGVAGYTVLLDGTPVRLLPASATSTTIAGLVDETHTIGIRATDAAGNVTTASQLVGAGVEPPEQLPPTAPQDVTAVAGDGSATVGWSAVTADPVVSSYTVTATPGDHAVTVAAPATSATLSGLTNGTPYTVTVVATSTAGTSPASAGATVTPVAEPTDPEPTRLTAPVLTSPTTGPVPSPVRVTWDPAVAEAGVASYTLEWGGTSRELPADATSTRLTVPPGTYELAVVVTDAEGSTARSAPVTVTVTDPPPAGFPDVAVDHPLHTSISWLKAAGVTQGYSDGTYRPGRSIARDAMAAFLYRLAAPADYDPPATPRFRDVGTSHPFYAEISWLADAGISTGYADGTFRPDQPISRDAIAAFLFRMDAPADYDPPATPRFHDVGTSHPFYAAVSWLADAGITTGFPDGTFRPGRHISREAMAAFLHRFDTAV